MRFSPWRGMYRKKVLMHKIIEPRPCCLHPMVHGKLIPAPLFSAAMLPAPLFSAAKFPAAMLPATCLAGRSGASSLLLQGLRENWRRAPRPARHERMQTGTPPRKQGHCIFGEPGSIWRKWSQSAGEGIKPRRNLENGENWRFRPSRPFGGVVPPKVAYAVPGASRSAHRRMSSRIHRCMT